MTVDDLKIKIFADGANVASMLEMYNKPYIKGFTTNPTLMRQADIDDYEQFAKEVLNKISDKPISFEIISDDLAEMEQQALKISSWGNNVNVKIPISNTEGEFTYGLVKVLTEKNVTLNVTALFTLEHVEKMASAMRDADSGYISVFAGRIADTGVDPVPHMKKALKIMNSINLKLELIWASPRELLNVIQANDIGCHIITVSNGILDKLKTLDKDLDDFSLDTVKMFYNDATKSNYKI